MPNAAHDQAKGLSELEMDMFDAIIRSFIQSDDELYRLERSLRWRHFFEPDILVLYTTTKSLIPSKLGQAKLKPNISP